MSHRKFFILLSVFLLSSSFVFAAGSFFDTVNQAKETGKAGQTPETVASDTGCPEPEGKDSPADHDQGKGNDDKQPKADEPKDSPTDHDQGKGNDDKTVVNPNDPPNNPEVDPKGEYHPKKVVKYTVKELTKVITTRFKVKVTVDVKVKVGFKTDCSWSHSHLFAIYRTLYALPRHFICKDLEIRRVFCGHDCRHVWHDHGMYRINVCDEYFRFDNWTHLFVREMARVVFVSREFSVLRTHWLKTFWKDEFTWKIKPPFVQPCRTPDEDFAESFTRYWCGCRWLHDHCLARYEFIHRLVMKGRTFVWEHPCCSCYKEVKTVTVQKTVVKTVVKTVEKTVEKTVVKTGTCTKTVVNTGTKTATVTGTKTGVSTGKVVNPPAKTGVSTGTATGTKTNAGGGDHGASGKTDQNDKNKDNNASKANNSAGKTTGSGKK